MTFNIKTIKDGKSFAPNDFALTGDGELHHVERIDDALFLTETQGGYLLIPSESNPILEAILVERQKQNTKWGAQNHNLVEWVAILGEEFGEVSREAVDYHFANQPKGEHFDTNSLGFEDLQQTRLENYRKELIQLAAVAVQMIESLDRNELTPRIEIEKQPWNDTLAPSAGLKETPS